MTCLSGVSSNGGATSPLNATILVLKPRDHALGRATDVARTTRSRRSSRSLMRTMMVWEHKSTDRCRMMSTCFITSSGVEFCYMAWRLWVEEIYRNLPREEVSVNPNIFPRARVNFGRFHLHGWSWKTNCDVKTSSFLEGFISMDEMYKFLTSVFKVVLTPASRQFIGRSCSLGSWQGSSDADLPKGAVWIQTSQHGPWISPNLKIWRWKLIFQPLSARAVANSQFTGG